MGGGGWWKLKNVNTTPTRVCTNCTCVGLVRTDLWGEPISDRVHVVAGCRGAHESVGVAGEGMAIGREAVSRAAVSAKSSLVHGGWRQGLGSMQRAAL